MDELLMEWLTQCGAQYILDAYTKEKVQGEALYSFVQRVFQYTAKRFDKEYDFWREHWEIGAMEAV